jgi:anhydro-N-acetylmuramic acid kinase
VPGPDGVRTAVALTVASVGDFLAAHLPVAPEVVVAGGGTAHPVLMAELGARLAGGGMMLRRFDELFFPAAAKEAVAFALLGWLTLHGQPGTLPQVTGARGPRIAGSVTPA